MPQDARRTLSSVSGWMIYVKNPHPEARHEGSTCGARQLSDRRFAIMRISAQASRFLIGVRSR